MCNNKLSLLCVKTRCYPGPQLGRYQSQSLYQALRWEFSAEISLISVVINNKTMFYKDTLLFCFCLPGPILSTSGVDSEGSPWFSVLVLRLNISFYLDLSY